MTMFGVYTGNSIEPVKSFEAWIGRPLDTILAYINNDSWSGFDTGTPWAIGQYKGLATPIVWGVPLTVWGTSLEQIATGAYNNHFQSAASQILASRAGDSDPIYIRIGWEFNGDWMPWAAKGHEAAFIKAFQQEADVFHNTSSRFKIVWDTTNDGGNMNPETAYPGDKYVDVIGTDTYYDPQWDGVDGHAAFQKEVSRPHGLQWLSDFANAHGKATAMSEWGVTGNQGGGDYVKDMAAWMTSHNMVYGNYWESDNSYKGLLETNAFPNTAAAFKEVFGPQAAPAPAPVPGHTLTFSVSEDAYKGDAQFVVLVDGKQVGDTHTVTASHSAGQSQDVSVAVDLAPGDHTFGIKFVNDLYEWSSTKDRNLYVSKVALDGTVVSTTGANLLGNDTATFKATVARAAAPDTIVLKVSGDSYQGDAQFLIWIDGKVVGDPHTVTASHAQGQWQDVSVTAALGQGDHTVDVQFLNDAYGYAADKDRNLYVKEVSVDGNKVSTIEKALLWSGATATTNFHLGTDDTLAFKVSQDAYQGDAHFVVKVNGHQVGDVQTAHASHAAGQTDSFVFHGAFGASPDVSVEFLNDAYGGTANTDRNLYVHEVSLNGHAELGSEAVNGAGWNSWDTAQMFSKGEAHWLLG